MRCRGMSAISPGAIVKLASHGKTGIRTTQAGALSENVSALASQKIFLPVQ